MKTTVWWVLLYILVVSVPGGFILVWLDAPSWVGPVVGLVFGAPVGFFLALRSLTRQL